jgi:hypothetical protein
MKRSGPLARHATLRGRKSLRRGTGQGLKRSTPLKARRTPERGDPEFRAFIRGFPCVVCGKPAPSECCHITGKRLLPRGPERDRGTTYPGCHDHHHEQHQHGILTFQRKYSLDLPRLAAAYRVRYEGRPR